ncbi:MAG: serine/threonine protein kinase [Candidatus Marinamargulisbacteria bacterium]|jgi:serine/threonine protein kinase
MAYIEGHTIESLLTEGGSLPKDYLFQAVQGLNYFHSQNVFHLDINPCNILISNQGLLTFYE